MIKPSLRTSAPSTAGGATASAKALLAASDSDVTRALAEAYEPAADTAENDADDDDDSTADTIYTNGDVATKPLSWDERRRLTLDIVHLAPPDLPGVLLLAHTFNAQHTSDTNNNNSSDSNNKYSASVTQRKFAPPPISQWDATTAHNAPTGTLPPSTATSNPPLQLECAVDLDAAHPELLHRLRAYVDNCYVPHYVPRENCSICEGLWSSGRVIACGNDACDTRIHEECFGVVLRNERDGPWRCPSCLFGKALLCIVCMQYGGALKPVASASASNNPDEPRKWIHTLCALAIPELVLRDVPTMEPVDGVDAIENSRFRYLCNICRKRGGASVICDADTCNVGMHPLCAANAGLMVGNDANPLSVYCEKHLPLSRVFGAKRLISDEDLVEEIVSETNSIDDLDELDALDLDAGSYYESSDDVNSSSSYGAQLPQSDAKRFAFILESTPFFAAAARLRGDRATLPLDTSNSNSKKRLEIQPTLFDDHATRHVVSWGIAADAGGWKLRRPSVYPPVDVHTTDRIGLAPFPTATALVGAIVDVAVKPVTATTTQTQTQTQPPSEAMWRRARVVAFDAAKQLHVVELLTTQQQMLALLTVSNTLVLALQHETNVLDGMRVRLVRAVTHGEAHWRPKPRVFASASALTTATDETTKPMAQ